MRNKKSFSFDEEKDAEKFYNDGFPNKIIDYSKMYLIAKYIRQTFGLGEIRLEKELIRFCKNQDNNFNPITESQSIKKWVNSAMNYNLRKISSITISQGEIDFLKTIENNRDRKLLFASLVLSKALKKSNIRRKKGELKTSENYYIHYSNFLDIIRLSKTTNISETDFADILNKYKTHFTFYNAERELIRLNFIDKHPKEKTTMTDLKNISDYYNTLFEEHRPIITCIKCGKTIKKNSNIQKYCKDCAKIVNREQHKELMRVRRSVTK